MFTVSITALLNTISAYWHMAGVVFIVLVLIIVPDNHQSIGYVFGETVNVSGYGNATDNFSNPAFWFVFGLGLLLSQYTITGFDASAHMAEETQQASRMAAVGMYMAVVARSSSAGSSSSRSPLRSRAPRVRSRTSASSSRGSGRSR